MKNKIVLFITGCFALVLSSCLKSEDVGELDLTKNCQISTFKMQNDSVKGLSDVKFTIDQLSGRIFNMDSLPYGTKIEKVVCKVTYAGNYSVAGVQISPEALGDSTYWWNGSDSLDYSAPVRFVVHGYDGQTTKVYMTQVNIHQVKPDSMVWGLYSDPMIGIAIKEQKVIAYNYKETESYFMYVKPAESGKPYQLYHAPAATPKNWTLLALSGLPTDGVRLSQITEYEGSLYVPTTTGALYQSVDGQAWTLVENTPSVKYLLGVVKQGVNQVSSLATVVDKAGVLSFYAMDKSMNWTAGGVVPSRFPLTGFGATDYNAMYYEYLMVAAGRDKDDQLTNTAWGTMNGTTWVLLSDETSSKFDKREGVVIANYDEKLFLIGGINASGKAQKDIHISIDKGLHWSRIDTLVTLPSTYAARGFSSVVVDKQNFVNIFGGKTTAGSNDLNQLWRGRIFRLVPKE